jgi:uncharacterized membrane protein YhaH (DUF805 family)
MTPQYEILPYLIWSLYVILLFIPALTILRRAGKSRWWSVLAFVFPIGTIGLYWIIAYSRWPNESRR